MNRFAAVTIAIFFIGIATLFAVLLRPSLLWPVRTFESSIWKTTAQEQRYVFARDIISRNVLLDKSATEAQALLGTPTFAAPGDAYWTYVVGDSASSSFALAHVFILQINFSPQARVNKALIRSD